MARSCSRQGCRVTATWRVQLPGTQDAIAHGKELLTTGLQGNSDMESALPGAQDAIAHGKELLTPAVQGQSDVVASVQISIGDGFLDIDKTILAANVPGMEEQVAGLADMLGELDSGESQRGLDALVAAISGDTEQLKAYLVDIMSNDTLSPEVKKLMEDMIENVLTAAKERLMGSLARVEELSGQYVAGKTLEVTSGLLLGRN
eukprot:TRINITY_DN815_c0_g1_i1.p1 TRINITY_DN815_c0_g1~~TRINITY_DN815_c0_g1_i1.p1  ORF type:complete len:204 (-),score=45.83 TRINITY_DN815_c0_g1_i1:196-807(-)